MDSNHKIIEEACIAIAKGHLTEAKQVIENKYPFKSLSISGRQYTEYQKTKIFLRDGFVDRYSGENLVFPPVIRLLSTLMPEEFPYHKNWKMSECHLGYWQLLPTVDHIIPVSRGGEDEESNWVSTSQLRNSAKSNWLLEELGWQLHTAGNLQNWDGLIGWFMSYAIENPNILKNNYLSAWYKAADKAIKT